MRPRFNLQIRDLLKHLDNLDPFTHGDHLKKEIRLWKRSLTDANNVNSDFFLDFSEIKSWYDNVDSL